MDALTESQYRAWKQSFRMLRLAACVFWSFLVSVVLHHCMSSIFNPDVSLLGGLLSLSSIYSSAVFGASQAVPCFVLCHAFSGLLWSSLLCLFPRCESPLVFPVEMSSPAKLGRLSAFFVSPLRLLWAALLLPLSLSTLNALFPSTNLSIPCPQHGFVIFRSHALFFACLLS